MAVLHQRGYNFALSQTDHDEHYRFITQPLAIQCVIHRPAASTSFGQLVEIQNLHLHPRLTLVGW